VGKLSTTVAALFPRSGFARNVMMMSSATAVGQAIAILAAPVLTRLYSPEDFGVLGIYAAILGIVSVVASLRYEQAIPIPRRAGIAANVLVLSLSIVAATSLVSVAVIFAFGAEIAEWTNIPGQSWILYLVPLGVLLTGVYQVLNNWAVRQRSFSKIAGTTLLQGGSSTATQVALGVLGSGPAGLVAGQILGRSAGITSLARLVLADPSRPLRWVSRPGLFRVARRYRRFPQLFTWSALLNSIGLLGPAVVLAGFYGAAVVGWLGLVQRLLGAPTTLLGRSVTNVYFSESARLARETPAELEPLFARVLGKMALIGGVTIIPAGLVSPWVFPFIFGADWATAGRYALILSPMIFMQFLSSPFGVTLAVLERQDLAILRETIRIVLLGFALLIARAYAFSAEWAVIALSIAGTMTYLGHLYISWLAIRRNVTATGVSN
jgi:O-antigen/teichoic acid export membrane protein